MVRKHEQDGRFRGKLSKAHRLSAAQDLATRAVAKRFFFPNCSTHSGTFPPAPPISPPFWKSLPFPSYFSTHILQGEDVRA